MKLSIVIVSYNVSGYLEQCLSSLTLAQKGIDTEIIVVDNASSDATVSMVRNRFPDVVLIENAHNGGYAKANNDGFRVAKGEYVLILNPDTILPENALDISLKYMEEKSDVGALSLKLVNSDGSFQAACRRGFPTPSAAFYRLVGLNKLFPNSKRFGKYNLTYLSENEEAQVDALCGAYMLVRKDVLDLLEGFDEDYFMFGEDLDLCFRIKKAGYKVVYYPEASVIHFKGRSSLSNRIKSRSAFYESMYIFSKKHLIDNLSFIPKWFLYLGILLNAFVKTTASWAIDFFPALADAILINISLLVMLKIRFGESLLDFVYYNNSFWPIVMHITLTATFIGLFTIEGLYKKDNMTLTKFFRASFIASLLFFAISYFIKDLAFSRHVFAITSISVSILLPLWRVIIWPSKVLKGFPFTKRKVAVLGVGEAARNIRKQLELGKATNYQFAGYIGQEKKIFNSKRDSEVLGYISDLDNIIKNESLYMLVYADPDGGMEQFMYVVNLCASLRIPLKVPKSNDIGSKDLFEV